LIDEIYQQRFTEFEMLFLIVLFIKPEVVKAKECGLPAFSGFFSLFSGQPLRLLYFTV
jgi:hypothetical protein